MKYHSSVASKVHILNLLLQQFDIILVCDNYSLLHQKMAPIPMILIGRSARISIKVCEDMLPDYDGKCC